MAGTALHVTYAGAWALADGHPPCGMSQLLPFDSNDFQTLPATPRNMTATWWLIRVEAFPRTSSEKIRIAAKHVIAPADKPLALKRWSNQ
jgi:hypothetical protein